MSGYLAKFTQVRHMLDGRYDDIKSGRIQPIDGEDALARLRHPPRQKKKSQDRRHSGGPPRGEPPI